MILQNAKNLEILRAFFDWNGDGRYQFVGVFAGLIQVDADFLRLAWLTVLRGFVS